MHGFGEVDAEGKGLPDWGSNPQHMYHQQNISCPCALND